MSFRNKAPNGFLLFYGLAFLLKASAYILLMPLVY